MPRFTVKETLIAITLIALSVTCHIACELPLAFWENGYWEKEHTFGRSQFEQFIRDRPGVGDVINSKPALRRMLESGFEGDERSGPIYWDHNKPFGPGDAECSGGEHPAYVRVRNSPDISAVDKCACLVYELINSSFGNEYVACDNLVTAKQISREDYARSTVLIEMSAMQKTNEYFRNNAIANEDDLANPHYVTFLHFEKPDYMQWLQSESNKSFDLFEYYRQRYDYIKLHTLDSTIVPMDQLTSYLLIRYEPLGEIY